MKWSPTRTSLRDIAYETIRKKIITCEMRPGQSLTVIELSDALNIGRTPVIQAIDRLVVEGLIQVIPRKGIVVSPIRHDELVDIIQMRIINEVQAARWAAKKANNNDICNLNSNLIATKRAINNQDIEQFILLDRKFHRIITNISGNRVLIDFLNNIQDKALRLLFTSLRMPDHNLLVFNQHSNIVEAIKAVDSDAAEAAMREHLASFESNAMRQIMPD